VDFRGSAVHRSFEKSLERLRLDRVDIVYLHDPGADTPYLSEAIRALDRMREDGLIRAIGIGGSEVNALEQICDRTHIDVFVEAGVISLLEHAEAARISRIVRDCGVRVIAAGVFNSGILAASDPAASTYSYRRAPQAIVHRVIRIRRLCARYNVDPVAAAVQYPFRIRGVESVLVGAANPDEVAADVDASDAPIPSEFWREFEATE